MTVNRRDVLKLAGVTTAAAATAGCLDDLGLGGADLPAYEQWLSIDDDGELEFAYVDLEALEEYDDEPDGDTDDDPLGDVDDPMLAVPVGGMILAGFAVGFGLSGTGIDGITDVAEDEDESEFDSSIAELVVANDGFVLLGDVDAAEVDEALTDPPEADGSFGPQPYERTDEVDDYDVYEPIDDAGDGVTVAVDDDAIVVHEDGVEGVRTVIETHAGDQERATDERDDLEWLLESAGHGNLVFGGYGGEFDSEDVEGTEGLVASLTIESEDETTGDVAGTFEELDEAERDELDELLGSSADEVDVDFEDDQVTASATWDEDALENL